MVKRCNSGKAMIHLYLTADSLVILMIYKDSTDPAAVYLKRVSLLALAIVVPRLSRTRKYLALDSIRLEHGTTEGP